MARQLHQLSDVQEAFAARIRRKIQEQREQVQDQANDIAVQQNSEQPTCSVADDHFTN